MRRVNGKIMAAAGGCNEEGEWGDFVKATCPKSCELCGEIKAHGFDAYLSEESCTPKSHGRCDDWCDECKAWAKDGECGRYYVFEKCPLSCHDPVCECKDTCQDACEDWASRDMCKIPWIDAHCAKSCEWENCTTTTVPPTPSTTPKDCTCKCEPFCHNQAAAGGCSDKDVKRECPCVCDPDCIDPTPDTTPATTPNPHPGTCDELCTDSMGQFAIPGEPTKWCHCSNWLGYVKDCYKCTKMQGHPLCEKYDQKAVFDSSKGQCDWPEDACKHRSDCPYTAVAAVKREYADCKFWAANGDCFTGPNCGTCDWQKWVCNNCPSECSKYGDCHSANKPTPPTPTNDKYADCKFWAANGDCYDPAKHTQNACGTCDWQYWVAANCPTSCANH